MNHPLNAKSLELFDEKENFNGPFSKTVLLCAKETSDVFIKRLINDFNKSDLYKLSNIFNKQIGVYYFCRCSTLPLYLINSDSFKNAEPIIITSYFKNRSLKDAIQSFEKKDNIKEFDSTQKLIIIYGILLFLVDIHNNKQVHGRLKASNILLDLDYNPFVSDPFFYQMNPFNKSNIKMIDYIVSLPPEVLSKNSMNSYNVKSDIYSFGIILLQIFTCQINVYSDFSNDPQEIINIKMKGTMPKIPDLSNSQLQQIIEKCLDINPTKRPTAIDIMNIIEKIASNNKNYDTYRFKNFMKAHQIVGKKLNQELTKIKKLADEGDAKKMYQYGLTMLNGKNCQKDVIEGRKYIGKAANKEFSEAQKMIIQIHSELLPSLLKSKSKKQKNHIYLKDDPYYKREKPVLSEIIEKVKKIKKFISDKVFNQENFKNKGFVFTDGAIKRLTKLYYYLDDGVPVLLEGPTGTSKTLSSEIVCKLSNREIIRFNLSSDTKSNYLLGRYIGDPKSWAGISLSIGPFIDAFRNGKTLLLDEINLASQECLQFIEEALDNGVICVELPGMPLEEIKMHEDFRLIATQNPNKGSFANKRYDLDNKFLSRFQVINFPAFDEDELIKIAKGLCKSFKCKVNDDFIEDLVKFHMKWSSRDDVKNDVQCFTVREIASTIHALSDTKNNTYDTIMTIYGARYPKEKKDELKELFFTFNSFKKLTPSENVYFQNFPHCYRNDNLEEALKAIFFSFKNNRNVILTAKEGFGITQIAKWVAQCYDKDNLENKLESINENQYFCVCTEETKCSDLIGYQKPSEKIDTGQELIVWQNGFLTNAIQNGKCAVLDSLDEAPSTVAERLNVLLDEKYDNKTKKFEIPENPQGKAIKINPKFRLLCTCRIDNINQMSPAFINRFDVVVLENQLEKINNDNLKKLIELLMKETIKSIPQMPIIQQKNDYNKRSADADINDVGNSKVKDCNSKQFTSHQKRINDDFINDSDEDFSLEDDEITDNFISSDHDTIPEVSHTSNKNLSDIKKYKNYVKDNHDSESSDFSVDSETSDFSLVSENDDPIETNSISEPLKNNQEDYGISELIDLVANTFDPSITIYKLSQLCKSIIKFNAFFKDASPKIPQSVIVEFAKDLVINIDTSEEPQNVPKEIEDFLINKLNKNEDNLYFYEESPPLRTFIAKLFACSIINLPVCVYGATGVGKTTSARSFSCMRRNFSQQQIPFRMHSFHVGTRPSNFYGSITIKNGKVAFINGTLTECLKNGYTFIADEMNLSSLPTMKSLAPALEQCIGESIYIPGVSEPIVIHSDFFFIACQNEVGTIGRNVLPSSIASRLKILYYPIQKEEDISSICVKIAMSYNSNDKRSFTEDDAKKVGKFMIELNEKQKVIPQWSLRDITKIFKRIYYQETNPDFFYNGNNLGPISLLHNILFYTLAPVSSKDQEEIFDTILDLLCNSFNIDESKKQEYKMCFMSIPALQYIDDKLFLMKGNIGISTINLNQFDKYKDNFANLHTLLNSIFQVLLSHPSEPILLTGPSGFKTFLAQLFLINHKVIALNQETTVPQLIGTPAFLSISEAKLFYLDHLFKICNIYDSETVNSLKEKLMCGELEQNDIMQFTRKTKKIKSSFKYAIEQLKNKLFIKNEFNGDQNILSDMIIEFRPGQILSAIFEGKSIIFKDVSNLPTVVLERFNELFSGEHNLTVNEDYYNTFTSSKDKELKNFSSTFRAFATCPQNMSSKLSEAVLSRFTVINVPSYERDELENVLNSYNIMKNKKLPKDLTDKIIKFSKSAQKHIDKSLSFTQMINILDICSRIDTSSQKKILGIVLYRIFGGLIEKRHKKISLINTIFEEIDLKLPSQIINPTNENPLVVTEKKGLESKITGLFIPSINAENVEFDVEFTKSFVDMIDIIHLGISSKVPVILEGNSCQGKQKSIQMVAKYLGYEVINIIISKSTKVDDLLGKVTIETDEDNNIHVKPIYTKLTKEIEYKSEINNKIFVFHNLNNASPAVLEKLTSLFDRKQVEFSLPDGTTISKGHINVIGIFNPQNGISNREKLPSSLIFSSIYHIVDNPSIGDVYNIISKLFNQGNQINLEKDRDDFFTKFKAIKIFEKLNNAYPPITLYDINKYIAFREVTYNKFSKGLIYQMLFGYRFLQQDTIDQALSKLQLENMIFQPIFILDEENHMVSIKESEQLDGLCLNMNPNADVDIKQINDSLKTLTLAQQQCLLFLACSILSKRACIIQGTTASGKSHIIRLFANMLGQKLNVYQMNSDTDISFITGQSVLRNELTEVDEKEFNEAFCILNNFETLKEFVDTNFVNKYIKNWEKEKFSELLNKIEEYKEQNELTHDEIKNLNVAISKINKAMSPAKRFHKQDSAFMKALENGEWVLIDGIESAPPEIAEKLSSLCGDDPEIYLFEGVEDSYFSRNNSNGRKIHENFHLFVTYNPSSKTGIKVIDPLFLNKCVSFTIPPLDSTMMSSSRLLIGSLINMGYDNEFAFDIGQRFASSHQYAKIDSETDRDSYSGNLQFTARTLTFILKNFKRNITINENPIENIDKTIYNALNLYYWNTYINKSNKKQFKLEMIKKLSEDPQNNNFVADIKDVDLRKKYETLLQYLRNIQLFACKNIDNDTFNFADFIEKCGNVQLIDISFIIGHLSDTLNIIKEKITSNDKNKQHLLEDRLLQIQIIKKLFKEIEKERKSIKSEYLSLQLISDNNILLSATRFKKTISKLIFLNEITKMSLFCKSSSYILNNDILVNLLKTIVEMSKKPSLAKFDIFISKLHQNIEQISLIDVFFPYFLFKENKLNMIVYWMPAFRQLCDKKVSFSIKIYDHVYEFIFEEHRNIRPVYVFTEKSFPLLSKDSEFHSTNKKDKISFPWRSSENEWNNKFYEYTKSIITYPNQTISQLKVQKIENNNELHNHYISMSTLYHQGVDDSLVSKAWSIVYTFEDDTIQLLKSILHPLEADILDLIFNLYSYIDEYKTDELINITNRLSHLGNEKSKLWIYLNNEYSPKDKSDTIENITKETDLIKNEIRYWKEFPLIKLLPKTGENEKIWSSQKYVDHLQSLLKSLKDALIVKLEKNETQKVHVQLNDLVEILENKEIKNNAYVFLKDEIIKLITEISEKSPKKDDYDLCNSKVQEFIACLARNEPKFSTFIWPSYSRSVKYNTSSTSIKLYNNVIWFSQVKSILNRICDTNNNSPFEDIFQLNKFPEMQNSIQLLMKQIMKNKTNNEFRVETDEKNILNSILNAHFLYKFLKDGLLESIPKLDERFNKLALRKEIDENEIQMIRIKINEINPKLNLILPKYDPKDLIYLYIGYNGSEKINKGPLFNEIECIDKDIENLYNDSKNFVDNIDTFTEYADNIARSILKSLFDKEFHRQSHSDLENKLNTELEQLKKDKLTQSKNYKKDYHEKIRKKALIQAVLNTFKISKILDTNKINYEFIHDDNGFLKKDWLKNKEYVQKYPSLVYWLIKNQRCCTSLQSMFSNSELNNHFLPFGLFALRIMSSQNCISLDMDLTTENSKIISQTIMMNIKNSNICGTDWLNLVLPSVPFEISNSNINMFYDFLMYISNDNINVVSSFINDCKKNAIEKFINNVCNCVLRKNEINSILNKPFANFTDFNLCFIKDPNECIIQEIKQKYEDSLKNLIKEIDESYQTGSQTENNIINEIKNLKNEIDVANESKRNEFLRNQKNILSNNIRQYNELLQKLKSENQMKMKEYSEKCEQLISLYDTLKEFNLKQDKKNSLTIYQLEWNKNINIQYIISKKILKFWKYENDSYMMYHSKKYYFSQISRDNGEIQCKQKKDKKGFKYEWNDIIFNMICKDKNDYDQILSLQIKNPKSQLKIPKLKFGEKNKDEKEFISELESVNKVYSNLIEETKKDIQNRKITGVMKYIKKFDLILKSLKVNFDNKDRCPSVEEILEKLKDLFLELKGKALEVNNILNTSILNQIDSKNITSTLNLFQNQYCLPIPNAMEKSIDTYFSFNSLANANFLSVPILFVKNQNSIACSYTKEVYIGPLIPSLYSGEIVMNFVSFIDFPISMKVEIDESCDNHSVVFSSNSHIQPGEPVQINILLPSNPIQDIQDFPISANIIINSPNFEKLKLEYIFYFKLAPLSILFTCKEYKLALLDDMLYLCAPQILPNSVITFAFQTFYVDEKIEISHQLIDFDDNQTEKPNYDFNIEKSEFKLKVQNVQNPSKLHCKLNVKFLESLTTSIIIDTVIVPFEFGFDVYDYTKKSYVDDYPTFYYSEQFIDQDIIIHCRLYASSYYSGLTAIIENDFNEPASIISCPSQLEIQEDLEFDIKVKMKNVYIYALYYHISIKIGEKTKKINLKFEERKINSGYLMTNYLNSNYFYDFPVYGYDCTIFDWKKLCTYRDVSPSIICIVSPLLIYNKISLKKNNAIPKINFPGIFSNTFELLYGYDNKFFLINDRCEFICTTGNKYVYSMNGNIPLFGVCHNDWYPLYEEYHSYFKNNIYLLDLIEDNIEIAKQNLLGMPKYSLIYKNTSFCILAQLFYTKFSIIKNLPSLFDKLPSPFKNDNDFKKMISKIDDIDENDWSIPIIQNNVIFFFYTIFNSQYDLITQNNYHLPNIINDLKIQEKQQQCSKEYFSISEKYISEGLYKKIKKIKNSLEEFVFSSQPKEQFESFLLNEHMQKPQPNSKNDIPQKIVSSEAQNSISDKVIDIPLPKIDIPNDISKLTINNLNRFYQNCTESARLFPIHVKNMLNKKDPQMIIECKEYFLKLLHIYKSLPVKDMSLISKSVNTFSRTFATMIKKFENAGVDFGSLVPRKIIITEQNNQEYIQYPDKIRLSVDDDEWKFKSKFKYGQSGAVVVNQSRVTTSNPSNIDIDSVSIPSSYDNRKNPQSSSSFKGEVNPDDRGGDGKIVYTPNVLDPTLFDFDDESDQSDLGDDDNSGDNKKKKIAVSDPNGARKDITIDSPNFDHLLSQFTENDGIQRAINLMSKIDPDGEYDNQSYNFHPFDEKYLKPNIDIFEDGYPILSLIQQSFIFSQEFIKIASNLEIPYSTISVNILIDCSKFISKLDKAYNMMIICALTDAITTFGIPYAASVVADSNFKCVIKPFSENHSVEALQRICDCIMIDRFMTELPDCMRFAIKEMQNPDETRKNRAIFTFTNGLDENLVGKNQWINIFNDPSLSFGFIFIKSQKLTSDNLNFLEEKWDNFKKYTEGCESFVKVSTIIADNNPVDSDGKVSDKVIDMVKMLVAVIKGKFIINENDSTIENGYEKPIFKLPDEVKLTSLYRFKKCMENKYNRLNNIFIKKTNILKNVKPNMDKLIVKHYNNNLNQILTCAVDDSIRKDFSNFIKEHIKNKKKINMSSKEIIFKPNKASRLEASSSGTVFDISALILYLINPVPEPMIYLEEKGGLIRNYGISIVIDVSYSCFNPLSASHSFQTIMSILSSLSTIDLPCFDLIIATESAPIVICSGVKTLYALNERSSVWNSLFAILQSQTSNTNRADLASGIHTAFDLRRMRSIQCTNILFVLTDGLYQMSERSRIINVVNNCVQSGINTFGIGIGIYPKRIVDLFPQVIFAENPSDSLKGISFLCENNYYDSSKEMSCINITFESNGIYKAINEIIDSVKDPIFKSLKEELSKIAPTIRAFRDFINLENPDTEITPDIANPTGDKKELYVQDFLKTQKILIVQLCDHTVCGDPQLNKDYIYKNYIDGRVECIESAVNFFGISIEVVQNYEAAIHELTKSKTEFCDYYACWIICSSHPEKMPESDKATNKYLIEQFIDVLIMFWRNGGSLVFWADNDPYTFQVNVFLNRVTFEDEDEDANDKTSKSKKVSFQIHGDNHPGGQMLSGDRTGKLQLSKLFNKKRQIFTELERASLSNNLYHIFEGSTLSYVENVGLNEVDKIWPFRPFAIDSDGGITSLFYPSNLKTKTGDIIIDCGFSKLFYELTTMGTYRYIRNIAAWTARPEVHMIFDSTLKPWEWRPKAVHYDIKFIEIPNYSQHVLNLISRAEGFKNLSVIKQNVKKLGGDIDCDLRFSIQWNDLGSWDKNDLDAHCIEPGGFEIMFNKKKSPNTNGALDVDIISPEENVPACENIRWKSINTMKDGTYRFFVHQYCYCNGDSGFRAEIEFNNRIYSYDYRKTLRQDEDVDVAYVTLTNRNFSISHKLPFK